MDDYESIREAREETKRKLKEAFDSETYEFFLPVSIAISSAHQQFVDQAEALLRSNTTKTAYVEALKRIAGSIARGFYRDHPEEIREWYADSDAVASKEAKEAVERHLPPVLDQLVLDYAAKFGPDVGADERCEQSSEPTAPPTMPVDETARAANGTAAPMPESSPANVVEGAPGSAEQRSPPQLQIDATKRGRGRPPIAEELKSRALGVLKAGGRYREAAKVLYETTRPDPSQCRSVFTILRRFDPEYFEERKKRKAANFE